MTITTAPQSGRGGRPDGASIARFDDLRKGSPAPQWLADAAIAAWGLDPQRTDLDLIAVSENATFRVSVDGRPQAVLRVHRPGYVDDPAQVVSELAWVEALADSVEVPVPEVRHRVDGGTVSAIHSPDGQIWYAVMFAFVSGTVLEDVADPSPYFRRIGEITAGFHQQARGWRPPEGFARFSWEPQDMVGPTARWGDWRAADLTAAQLRDMERAEERALAVVGAAGRGPEEWGLVHADLRPSNIMITTGESGADELTVIDFDDCGQTWYLYDFASALSFMEHCEAAPRWARDWVEGYASVTPLDDDELELACALSMLRRLQMLGWTTTHRADALPADLWEAEASGSARVAREYLSDSRWLLR